MAEGIQKKIEYADLQFISAFAMGKILDFQTWEIPGSMPEEIFGFCCQKMRQA